MTFLSLYRVGAGLLCLAAWIGTAAAQERPAAPADSQACAQEQRLQSGEQSPRTPNPGGETLTEKLARTDGVLCPPDVDRAMRAPTPDAGRTPVIPPPGGPGGDPSVRPK
jgi:hypothetical protein